MNTYTLSRLYTLGVFLTLTILTSCSKMEEDNPVKNTQELDYNDILLKLQNGEIVSDPFNMHFYNVANDSLKVNVSYSGGCETHNFILVWPEIITQIYPPEFSIILLHNANGDVCESYINRLFEFDLSNNPLHIPPGNFDSIKVNLINGSIPFSD